MIVAFLCHHHQHGLGFSKGLFRLQDLKLMFKFKTAPSSSSSSFFCGNVIEQPKSFFFEGMKKLVERYQKCIIVQGDYVEK
jgi:hypothetical protein